MKISVIASGSNGNCTLIETKDTSVLIDAGKSGKEIETRMNRLGKTLNGVDALLITHAHLDHISGAGILSRRYDMPIYISKQGYEEAKYFLGKITHKTFSINSDFKINDINIHPIKTAHSEDSCGFILNEFGYFTDTGTITLPMMATIPKVKGLLLESNHDVEMVKTGPYPYYLKKRVLSDEGHLSNNVASNTIQAHGKNLKLALLGHLSGTNNTEELALETFQTIVKRKMEVGVCSRHQESGTWEI